MPEAADAVIKLYFAPRTRAVRVLWLLEELDLPYQLLRVEFAPTKDRFFIQRTPSGKLPTLEDGETVMFESGAILEYLIERYGQGRLAPAPGAPGRAAFLQWLHFAEATAFPPLGIVVWLSRYREDADRHAGIIADARARALAAFEITDRALADKPYLLGEEFSAADIMMGFTLWGARMVEVLGDDLANVNAYLERLQARPACQIAFEMS